MTKRAGLDRQAELHVMRIDYLADHPDFIPTLAHWHHDEWSYLRPGDTVEARIARLRAACGRGEIPTVFVAFSDSTLFGSAMLIAHDMDICMDLTPWLAGVFVAPDYRRRGIGSALVGRVVECAARLGVRRLYLYTPSAAQMYSRLGWSAVERTGYRGADVLVMSRDVRPEATATAP
jgi:GNAT superfamily N-acetyltransferase